MNKTGNAIVVGLITCVLVVVLLSGLLFPVVRLSTQTNPHTETVTKTGLAAVIETHGYAYEPIDTSSLVIPGLTISDNYTTTNATLNLTNTANGTYSAYYSYYSGAYLNTVGERSLMVLVILAGIIGLIVTILGIFGLTGKQ